MGSLLMEPGAKLFQLLGGVAHLSAEQREREFLRSLWTMIPFPESFIKRIPQEWRDEILNFSPTLAPNGVPLTFSFIGELFEVPKADWDFVKDILQVDPDMRPTASELLQHSWFNSWVKAVKSMPLSCCYQDRNWFERDERCGGI